jgi:hypothetical protein
VFRKLCNSLGTGGTHIMIKVSLVKAWLWRPKVSPRVVQIGLKQPGSLRLPADTGIAANSPKPTRRGRPNSVENDPQADIR